MARHALTEAQQGAAPDRLQLRSFLTSLPVAGELGRCASARSLAAWCILLQIEYSIMIYQSESQSGIGHHIKNGIIHFVMRFAAAMLFLAAFLILVVGGYLQWVLRDGLGPDAITSSGQLAYSRFINDFWPLPIIAAILSCVGWFLFRKSAD